MRLCIFCRNRADSREHACPKWFLELLNDASVYAMRGRRPAFKIPGPRPEVKVRRVCHGCNNGWMSDLEKSARSILGPLMSDVGFDLSLEYQSTIARWAVKTAMVFEALRPNHQRWFYSHRDCQLMMTDLAIPATTYVWAARYAGRSAMNIDAYDVYGRDENDVLVQGYVSSFTFGHLALQLLSFRHRDGGRVVADPKPGPWHASTIQIWPSIRVLLWPPRLSFYDDGNMAIAHLDRRWSQGPSPDDPEEAFKELVPY